MLSLTCLSISDLTQYICIGVRRLAWKRKGNEAAQRPLARGAVRKAECAPCGLGRHCKLCADVRQPNGEFVRRKLESHERILLADGVPLCWVTSLAPLPSGEDADEEGDGEELAFGECTTSIKMLAECPQYLH